MPGMSPRTTVPHSLTDCRTRHTLSVLVCRANPKGWEPRPLFRASCHNTLWCQAGCKRPLTGVSVGWWAGE